MDATILAAIAAAAGAVIGKVLDVIIAKGKNKTKVDITYNELLMKENAVFRQEMKEEMRVLRLEVSELREENFQLRAENSRLLLRISELEDELKFMRKVAGYEKDEVITLERIQKDENKK
ncbi:hypothetical protein D3C81_1356450 [compost metagenome]